MADDAAVKACPICGKPRVARYRPFCSKRCADVDLGRWFSGAYVVPGAEEDEETPGVPEPMPDRPITH